MVETAEISKNAEPDGFNNIAAILAEQIAASHKAAGRCFSVAADEEDFGPAQRDDALRVASRLMHACAASANAIRRIKGGEFHHTITVDRIDVAAEKAARREWRKKGNASDGEARAELARKLQRLFEAQQENMKNKESTA